MSKRKTTEDFVRQAKDKHGDKFDYSLVDYVSANIKVKVICEKGHITNVLPGNHMKAKGCSTCSGLNKTNKDIIDNLIKKHGNKYDYSYVNYKGYQGVIKIICPIHNVFEQRHDHHLSGSGCPKCSNIKSGEYARLNTGDFIKKSKELHNDKYDYSLVEYKNAKTKVKIKCNTHGVFLQTPNSHLVGSGCPKCAGRNKDTNEFIRQSKIIHNNIYDYSLTKYTGNKNYVKIICPSHGVFDQISGNHLFGQGCCFCAQENRNKYQRNNPAGWSINNWSIKAKQSKHFDSFKVYIIRCWNDEEEFYKIGRTFNTVKKRFSNKLSMPYNYEVIKEFIFDKHTEMIDNARECFNKETELKRLNKENKYLPNIKFNGMNECYSLKSTQTV